MARLEIEIAGVNADLKRVLKESQVELSNFAKAVNGAKFDTNSTKAINDQKVALAALRTEAQSYRTQLAALRLQNAQNKQSTDAASGSYREAQQRLTALGRSIREAAGGFQSTSPAIRAQIKEYSELNTKLKAFDAQLLNHQRNVGNYASALRGLGGLAASYFGFTALLAGGAAVIRNNAKISDSLADVQRTAGLTSRQATELSKSLQSINTRTNLGDLLGIATIGGQLGVAKDQLGGFTEAVDELSVTLSGELAGGAEGIAKSLGVLDNVFKISASNGGDVRQAYTQIGSAILSLGQSGLATGDFLADFAERVGGIAKQAGLSLPTVLSFGAILQENGVNAEVAGTAFKRLISSISSNSAGFFKVAQFADVNLTLKDFNNIVNTDTKKALDLFFKGLKQGGSSTVAFNSILKSLKLSGSGVSQVIAALSSNLPALDKHITDTTDALDKGTLSAEQFEVKNNNLAASLNKLSNAFTNLTTNPDSNLGQLFKGLVDSITGGIKVIDILLGKLKEVQYDSAITRFDEQGVTGNIFIDETDVKSEKARRKALDMREKSNKALAAGRRLYHDAALDIKAEGNATQRLAQEVDKLNKIRSKFNTGKTKQENDEIAYQLITQKELVKALNQEIQSSKPRSTAETPAGITGGKKGPKTFSLSEELAELQKELVKAEYQFGASFSEVNADKIKAYQQAIDKVGSALGYTNSETLKLIGSQKDLFQLPPVAPADLIDFKGLSKEFDKAIKIDDRIRINPINSKKQQQQIDREARMFERELDTVAQRFGDDLYNTFSNASAFADQSFSEVFSKLSKNLFESVNSIFRGQLTKQLGDVVSQGLSSLSKTQQQLVGAAGILGGLVSGIAKPTSRQGQALGGALSGAATGAAIGSVVPGIGTVLGAIGGGLLGALGGIFGANKAKKEEKLRQQQLEEQKKQTALLERANALAYSASIIGRQTVNGIVTAVEVNEFGEITTKVSGQDLDIVLTRARRTRERGA